MSQSDLSESEMRTILIQWMSDLVESESGDARQVDNARCPGDSSCQTDWLATWPRDSKQSDGGRKKRERSGERQPLEDDQLALVTSWNNVAWSWSSKTFPPSL